jgi:flagellar biosynthesis/type III secretory pathway M-ring protein FliF/YscJ
MQDGEQANQQLVDAAADVVEGAQSGLARSRIKIVVGGVPRRLHDTDDANNIDGAGSDVLELQQKAEVNTENQIKDYFSYIPDLKVFVTVKVNPTSTQEHQQQFDPKKAVQKESETTSDTLENTSSNPASGDPGLTTNGGLAVGGPAASPGTSSTDTKETSKFQNFVSTDETSTTTPAGAVSVIAATVRVPVAYFEAIFARRNPDVKSPSDAQLQPLIDAELPKIRTDVMKCTGLVAESDVAVETYLDAAPLAAAAPQTASALSVTSLVSGHSRDLVIGGLAVMSLFMVSMMVRKGAPVLATPTPAVAGVAAPVGPSNSLNMEEALAGEVGGAGTMLNGMELDEDAVRNQQMLEQVSSMVKENPDAAATLVKRWMSRT